MIKKHSNAILIFGTFNPITNAHLNLAVTSRSLIDDSDVIFIPAKDEFLRDWKGFGRDSILENRISLLNKVTSELGFLVCDIEITNVVDGKSINTINYIRARW